MVLLLGLAAYPAVAVVLRFRILLRQALLRLGASLRQRRFRRWLLLSMGYAACEAALLWRFRLRMARLKLPRRGDRRGTPADLQWLARAVEHPVCPMSLSRESMELYLKEEQPDRKHGLDWEDDYALVLEAFCLAAPSPNEHSMLLRIATAMAKQQGISPPPADAKPTVRPAPIAFGSSRLQVVHKPLVVELTLAVTRLAADAVFMALGYRQRWLPTPEGWFRYWLVCPGEPDPAVLPAVFIHGVGLGAAPYLLFIERLRRARRAPLVVLELPNCSRSHFQAIMPSAASFRDALERLLRDEVLVTGPGRYVLLGHSLGTDFCSMVMNDPRLAHGDPALRPARLVLLDPVCFAHEIADAHRLPFWTLPEAREIARKTRTWWPRMLAVLLLVIRDEYNQEATKRAIVPGTDSIFRCSPSLLGLCPTLAIFSGNDQALPAWKVFDYVRAQFPEMQVRMDPGLEHGGFLMPWVAWWLSRSHAETVVRFLDLRASASLRRIESEPGDKTSPEEDRPLRRKSRSELSLRERR